MNSYLLRDQRIRIIDAFLAEEKRRRQELDAALEALDGRITEAERNETENYRNPEVLVRGSLGARRKVYHYAANPCGRTQYDGGHQHGFTKMRESDARLMDGGVLKRCSACWSD